MQSQLLRARVRSTAQQDTLATEADTLSWLEAVTADTVGIVDRVQAFSDFILDPGVWMAVGGALIRIVLIIIFTSLVIKLIDRLSDRMTKSVEDLPQMNPRRQRAFTISNLISSTARYFLWPVAAIMSLSALAIDVGALIATAGIAGLAIGFGAQTLVKDVIGGIFLLVDDTIHVGDLVKIGEDMGTVEYIGVRMLRVRKFDGEVLMVPAGELRIFGNRSIGFARAIVEVRLPYEVDVESVLPIMERVANEWAAENPEILREEQPLVQAITSFGESAVNARIAVMVAPGEQFPAERRLRLLLKRELDRHGIEIPVPRRTYDIRHVADQPRLFSGNDDPDADDEQSGSE